MLIGPGVSRYDVKPGDVYFIAIQSQRKTHVSFLPNHPFHNIAEVCCLPNVIGRVTSVTVDATV